MEVITRINKLILPLGELLDTDKKIDKEMDEVFVELSEPKKVKEIFKETPEIIALKERIKKLSGLCQAPVLFGSVKPY